MINYFLEYFQIDILEKTMNDQETLIRRLNTQLTDIHEHVQTLEMERETRNAEINDYKAQINNLNEHIRLGAAEKNLNIDATLEQQKQYEARVDKIKQDMQHILNKFTAVTNANAIRHQQELKVRIRQQYFSTQILDFYRNYYML